MENLFGEELAERASPVAPYLGGKSQLASEIVKHISRIKHQAYVEVFFGMGGVFYRRDIKPKIEVINDINGELVTFLRVLRSHPDALLKELQGWVTSRQEFDALKSVSTDHMTDIQRAVRFIYLQRLAFGGKVAGQTFGLSRERPARFDSSGVSNDLARAADRLRPVIIENLDWREILDRYDGEQVLFYLDPPYWGGERDYGKGLFERADFAEMARRLAGIKGRFILSLNDRPEVRALFSAFTIEPVALTYSISQKQSTEAKELIITN